MPESQPRRLAAILAADVAGYSALMGADDARTVRDLKGHQAVVLPKIAEFGGRIIDTAGDGILAEFASVMNALESAVAIQKMIAERNAGIAPARRMEFRIGVNIGDVIYDDVRIYGDGVNVAARLEALAEPGGIYISGTVFDHVKGKLNLAFDDLGSQQLKNIAQPVRVYSVRLEAVGQALAEAAAFGGKQRCGHAMKRAAGYHDLRPAQPVVLGDEQHVEPAASNARVLDLHRQRTAAAGPADRQRRQRRVAAAADHQIGPGRLQGLPRCPNCL
jgi:class 3 adenylate cyclase